MNESTGQIRYYVGNPTVPDTTTNLVMSLKTDKIEINKPAVLSDVLNTNTIDSNGISDITFRRNTFDIFYLRNSNLELNAGIDLVAPAQVQSNTYNSYDDSGVLLLRNGDEFMRFRKAEDDILVSKDVVIDSSKKLTLNNIDVPTATNLLFKVSGVTKLTLSNTDLTIPVGTNLLSDIIYGNSFGARQLGTDTSFYGSNAVGDTNVEYFRLNKTNETVNYIKDIVINNANQSNANTINISPALQPNSKRTICDWQRLGPAAWISDRVLPTWFPESTNRPHIRTGVLKISRETDNVKSCCNHRQTTKKRTCANLLTIVPTVIAAQ